MAGRDSIVPLQQNRCPQSVRRLAYVARALRRATFLFSERDYELKARLLTVGTAFQQLLAHIRRQGGAA
jgi:hypothetical protein